MTMTQIKYLCNFSFIDLKNNIFRIIDIFMFNGKKGGKKTSIIKLYENSKRIYDVRMLMNREYLNSNL
jgi:hypothetical protein